MRRLPLLLAAFALLLATLAASAAKGKASGNLYATIQTGAGNVTVQLFEKEAPIAVKNFVGLATGTKQYRDPKGAKLVEGQPTDYSKAKWIKGPYYDGILFHRVIAGFMIQAGCPFSRNPKFAGQGGPGYGFGVEATPSLRYDRPGRLGMAHSALPDSNGSQFFITVAPQPSLDGGYTIFGQVVKGQDVVNRISKVATSPTDRPLKPVAIKHVTVYRSSKPR